MNEISRSDIERWNNPFEFAIERDPVLEPGEEGDTPLGESSPETKNLQESKNVLRAAFDRLETIESNLMSMLQLAEEISEKEAAGLTKEDYQEYYGKIRSLAAGIDEIARTSKANGERVLDGSPINLAYDLANRQDILQLRDMTALGISERVRSAQTEVYLSPTSANFNKIEPIIGLVLGESAASAVDSGKEELETGQYRLKAIYEGANSKVQLMDGFKVLEEVENVDLSGDGEEVVDFGNGLSVVYNKTSFQAGLGFDKHDFENEGPANYYMDVSYTRVSKFQLAEAPSDDITSAVLSNSKNATDDPADGDGSISFTGASPAAVAKGEEQLEAGSYEISINYFGANSTATLRDSSGRLVEFKSRIDLSGNGEKTIDFGRGFSLNLENTDFSNRSAKLSTDITLATGATESKVVPTLQNIEEAEDDTGTLGFDGVKTSPVPEGEAFIEEGTYTVDVSYYGKNSMAFLRDEDGTLIRAKGQIDLTGSDPVDVNFGNGLTVSLVNDGYTDFSGKFSTEVVIDPESARERNLERPASVGLSNVQNPTDDGGTLTINEVEIIPPAEGEDPLGKDDYQIEIRYYGKNSIATLRNSEGRFIESITQVDLTGGGAVLSFDAGLKFTVLNNGYDTTLTSAKADVNYDPGGQGAEIFNYENYIPLIEQALETVREEITVVDDTYYIVSTAKELQDMSNPQVSGNFQNVPGTNAIQLLSGSISQNSVSLFQPSAATGAVTSSIMSIITNGQARAAAGISASEAVSLAGSYDRNAGVAAMLGANSSSVTGLLGGNTGGILGALG